MTDEEFRLDNRILCSDGSCIGVIGDDGKCKVCGRTYDGDELMPPPKSSLPAAPIDEPDAKTPIDGDEGEMDGGLDENPEDRVCCSDELCVGIIGTDGKCGTCGKM